MGLTLEDLENLIKRLDSNPTIRAVWVVDTPWMFTRLTYELSRFTELRVSQPFVRDMFSDITPSPITAYLSPEDRRYRTVVPLREWRSVSIDEDRQQLSLGRWFVRWPGVWMEMSNSKHVMVDVQSAEDASKLALYLARGN